LKVHYYYVHKRLQGPFYQGMAYSQMVDGGHDLQTWRITVNMLNT